MAVGTTCPSCGKTLRVEAELVGRQVRCPKCQEKFRIEHVEFDADAESRADEAALNTVDDGATLPESPTSSLPNGGTLGRFELQSVLGGGGFGVVYRAVDTHMGREVALKIPRFGLGESKKVRRFLTEARTAAKLRHPNIVPVFESGEVEGTPFIAAEFVPGETLASGLKRGRPDAATAAAWVRQLAEALAYAHDEGIVHRDVKPDNVMLDDRQRPQLMDFGLAKRIDEGSSMTADGSVLGTPSYMSPEQARGEIDRVGPASDQYSLGVVLYELLTGRKPFEGSPHAVIAQVVKDDPPAPRTLDTNIPPDIEAICQKAMEKDPSRRYADCGALAADLERWSNGEPIVARPIGPIGRLVRWSRREPLVAGLTVAVLLVSTIGFGAVTVLWGRAQSNLADATTQRGIAEANAREAAKRQQEAETALAEVERTKSELSTALAESKTNLAEAEKQRQLAVANAAEAAKRQKEAETAVAEADRQRAAADAERAAAEASSALATQRQREVRLGTYLKDINAAQQALRDHETERCRELLAKHVPENGAPDFRSIEWYYLLHASTELTHGPRRVRGEFPIIERARKRAPDPAVLRADRDSIGDGVTAIDVSHPKRVVYFRRTSSRGRHSNYLWHGPGSSNLSPDFVKSWPETASKVRINSIDEAPCVLSPDGKFLVGRGDGGPSHTVAMPIDGSDEKLRPSTQLGPLQSPIVVSPDGRFVVGASPRDAEAVLSTDATPAVGDGSLVTVYGSDGAKAGTFEPSEAEARRLATLAPFVVSSLVFSPDGTRLLVVAENTEKNRFVGGWLLAFDGGMLTQLPHAGMEKMVAGAHKAGLRGFRGDDVVAVFAPDGSAAAICDYGSWALLDLETGDARWLAGLIPTWPDAPSSTAKTHHGLPFAEFSPDGRTFVLAGAYGRTRRVLGSNRDSFAFRGLRHVVTVFERSAGGPVFVRQFDAHGDLITGLAFAPDGRAFLTASQDQSVRLWDAANGQERLRFDYSSPVSALAMSDDGTLIATGDDRGSVTLWQAPREVPDGWQVHESATTAPEDGVLGDPERLFDEGSPLPVEGIRERVPRRRSAP